MLTRADLWLFVFAALIVGVIVSLYFLPAYLADRKRWNEQAEAPQMDDDREMLGALARRAGEVKA